MLFPPFYSQSNSTATKSIGVNNYKSINREDKSPSRLSYSQLLIAPLTSIVKIGKLDSPQNELGFPLSLSRHKHIYMNLKRFKIVQADIQSKKKN